MERVYRHLVPPGLRVLELGCGHGDLLAALAPAVGVGVDFAPEMVRVAAQRHPQLRFLTADAHCLESIAETFDVVILSDLVNDVWDVQALLSAIRPLTTARSRLLLNVHSQLWAVALALAQRLGLATPTLPQSWLTVADLSGLLRLAGFVPIRWWREVLLPVPIPLLAATCNRLLVRLWPFHHLALASFLLARPAEPPSGPGEQPLVSVIVPARNEAGNVEAVLARTPEMGAGTEVIFVEGHSTDATWQAIEAAIRAHPERRVRALRQTGSGKGDAVRLGFAAAAGEVLMILDADLTVPPEDLPRFLAALGRGQGELINGVRLVYPMEERAMRVANLLANKLFSLAFTWLLGQPIKDTLCGTKVLRREDYQRIAAQRHYFGEFDPFGDFDLLFGAARLGLQIVEIPVRYRERTYGQTNIQRWRHGWLLLQMCLFAALRLKFV